MKKIINIIKEYKKEIGGLLRHAATIAGGVLIAKGSLTTDSFHMILGATSSIVGTGWSFANKISHKKEVKTALSTDPVTGDVTRKFNEETKTWESA
jgi:hypothetical protein|tara:strand:+ start:43 stop:330 length:288 start_codon:yes stop_codon:yes gene_type:complete